MSTDTPLHQGMPSWLLPEDKDAPSHADLIAQGKRAKHELDLIAFEAIFERALADISAGQPLASTLEADHRSIDYQRFLAWIHKDESRRARYYEAQEIGAEVVAAQMLEIADADDSLEDVARSTLRINTRKWLLGVWNRKRFGEVKQIEQNVTVDLGEAMRAAQARVDAARTIDVVARQIHG